MVVYNQPLRIYVSADIAQYGFIFHDPDSPNWDKFALSEFEISCPILSQLDMTNMHMAIENIPGQYPIQVSNASSPPRQTENRIKPSAFYKKFPLNVEIQTTSNPHYFNTFEQSDFARLPILQLTSSSCIGFPLKDTKFLNNGNIRFKATAGQYGPPAKSGYDNPMYPVCYNGSAPNYTNGYFTFTLVLWKNTP